LRDVVGAIRAKNAELVVIGNGSVEQAEQFRREQMLTFPLYTDPSLESYRQARLNRGLGSTFHPKVVLRGISAFRQGFRQTRTLGDPLQQGGVLVILAGGVLRFEYVSKEAGDHPEVARILDALN